MKDSQSTEVLMHVISATLQSAREYREMAKELLSKADALEREMLKVAVHAKETEDAFQTASAPTNFKDVFENFGDMFTGKKESKK